MEDKEKLEVAYKFHHQNAIDYCSNLKWQDAEKELKLAIEALIKLADSTSRVDKQSYIVKDMTLPEGKPDSDVSLKEKQSYVLKAKALAKLLVQVREKIEAQKKEAVTSSAEKRKGAAALPVDKLITEIEDLDISESVKKELVYILNMQRMLRERKVWGLPNHSYCTHVALSGDTASCRLVADILAKIYYTFELCGRPEVTRVSLPDILVADKIGLTGKRMNEIVEEKAVGGVLLIEDIGAYVRGESDHYKEAMNVIYCVLASCRRDISVIFADTPEVMERFLSYEVGISPKIPTKMDLSTPE